MASTRPGAGVRATTDLGGEETPAEAEDGRQRRGQWEQVRRLSIGVTSTTTNSPTPPSATRPFTPCYGEHARAFVTALFHATLLLSPLSLSTLVRPADLRTTAALRSETRCPTGSPGPPLGSLPTPYGHPFCRRWPPPVLLNSRDPIRVAWTRQTPCVGTPAAARFPTAYPPTPNVPQVLGLLAVPLSVEHGAVKTKAMAAAAALVPLSLEHGMGAATTRGAAAAATVFALLLLLGYTGDSAAAAFQLLLLGYEEERETNFRLLRLPSPDLLSSPHARLPWVFHARRHLTPLRTPHTRPPSRPCVGLLRARPRRSEPDACVSVAYALALVVQT
ncbi:hypothetical protein GALMADRAFT_148838 [Galerina marginata CBS 339.88]|uniref:Uncharacterized protein n=1 Tax=Galerina marginata (strain CBS 339.88) TaxID=685588 RepID=A0A067S5W1_GALM3|nr:hypothetical protein GALMADRAFT_148838 [Galerina marginata CBS 339.88]